MCDYRYVINSYRIYLESFGAISLNHTWCQYMTCCFHIGIVNPWMVCLCTFLCYVASFGVLLLFLPLKHDYRYVLAWMCCVCEEWMNANKSPAHPDTAAIKRTKSLNKDKTRTKWQEQKWLITPNLITQTLLLGFYCWSYKNHQDDIP